MKQRAHKTLQHTKLNAPMLQPILYTSEEMRCSSKHEAYQQILVTAQQRGKQRYASKYTTAEDGLMTDVRINIHRY